MSGAPELIEITSAGGTATISTHGATLVSWKTETGEELLFVSSKAIMDGSKAIRGGVPVCFPQFGMLGPLAAQHGFARTSRWAVAQRRPDSVTLRLESSEQTLAQWPHEFQLDVTVTVGDDRLRQELVVRNTGTAPFSFTTALHTYFRVSHISEASVIGLAGGRYHDNLTGQEHAETGTAVAIAGEVDRVYIKAPDTLKIADAGSQSALLVRKQGFQDAVVWNPWVEKAKALADLGDDDYQSFLCLEVAQARSGAVELPPGGTWHGSQTLERAEHTDI